jgi:hypothetical protein
MLSIFDFIGVGLQSLTIPRKSSNMFVKSSYSSLRNILPTGQLAGFVVIAVGV